MGDWRAKAVRVELMCKNDLSFPLLLHQLCSKTLFVVTIILTHMKHVSRHTKSILPSITLLTRYDDFTSFIVFLAVMALSFLLTQTHRKQ